MAKFLFLKQLFKKQNKIGAFLPSSTVLAKSMVKNINHDFKSPLRILEIGAGTGPITSELVKVLNSEDELILIEMNHDFCTHLTLQSIQWKKKGYCPKISIKEMNVFDYHDEKKFDFIICSLPLNNFSFEFVEKLMNLLSQLIATDGILSYYEYIWIRDLAPTIAPTSALRNRFKGLNQYFNKKLFLKKISTTRIWKNLPPADIHRFKLR